MGLWLDAYHLPTGAGSLPFTPTFAQSPCKVGTLPWTPKWRVDWGRRRSIRPRFENIWKTYGKSAWKSGGVSPISLPLWKNPQRDFGIPFKAIWGTVVLTGSGFTTNSSKKSSWNERPTKTVRKTILRLYAYTYKLPAINKITFTRLILYTLRKKWILGWLIYWLNWYITIYGKWLNILDYVIQ